MDVTEVKREIITHAKFCYERGLVSAAGGNISMRLGNRYFITATNESFRELRPESVVEIDADGNPVDPGAFNPSKEAVLHLAVYKHRPEVDSVIHVHPVFSIAHTVADDGPFPLPTVSARGKLRRVEVVPSAPGGSRELVDLVVKALGEAEDFVKTLVLAEHGILVFDKGMKPCYDNTELLEETAKINYFAATMKAAIAAVGPLKF